MKSKLYRIADLIGNMGWRYTAFRAKHELLRRSGLLKSRFPAAPPFRQYLTLDAWKQNKAVFFFESKEALTIPVVPHIDIEETFKNIQEGKLLLFNSVITELGANYDWVTNPDSGYRYDVAKHWTEIPDYSPVAGDIKYVWEKSRFSYLYDIIRYDYHYSKDCAEMVFADILSWIERNPVNCGPNYRCSQEMSLRLLNWTFALYYYRNSAALTEDVFSKMQYAIYWHLHHVYNNIQFSRIAVRNNHAITETLMLYLGGLLYPQLPDAAKWKAQGKAWFEEEIAYQIYEDGTFLQFSMNYHRVVVQLLTWAITLAAKNGEQFSKVVYDRAAKSVTFLRTCMIDEHGWLPNYGANDGALFFKLSSSHYRDYRPQVQALAYALGMDAHIDAQYEDALWYHISRPKNVGKGIEHTSQYIGATSFPIGGYYIIREQETLTFIKCGSYKDRPSQADNLHIDIWHRGENLLTDAGSYKYNTDADTIRYFSGTRSHNTVMLSGADQMQKGGRFIWYYWAQSLGATLTEDAKQYKFEGAISAFRQLGGGIVHKRTVIKEKGVPRWTVRDEFSNVPDGRELEQLWHVPLLLKGAVHITTATGDGTALPRAEYQGWSSGLYGAREQTVEYCFTTASHVIETVIDL